MAIMLIAFPMIVIGVGGSSASLATLTVHSTLLSRGTTTLATAEQQLGGAQPPPYCPNAPGSALTGSLIFTTPLASCAQPAQGPPAGIAGGYSLPAPATACTPSNALGPLVGPTALVVADPLCVGFFSYDYEGSATNAANTPLTPPGLVYVLVSGTTLETVTYAPGAFTAVNGTPTCAIATAPTYTNPCWTANSVGSVRVVGTLQASQASVFSYYGSANSLMVPATSPVCVSGTSAAQCAGTLAQIQVVEVTAAFQESNTSSVPSDTRIAVSGNVYQAQATLS
jgi:hypothetical protein